MLLPVLFWALLATPGQGDRPPEPDSPVIRAAECARKLDPRLVRVRLGGPAGWLALDNLETPEGRAEAERFYACLERRPVRPTP